MRSRLLAIVAWLAAAHAALLGLFWALLGVPESNALMIGSSAALTLLMLLLVAWIEGVGLAAWQEAGGPRWLARRGLAAMAPFLIGLVVFALAWWATALASAWWQAHRGEIDAWLMARFGLTRTSPFHAASVWVIAFLRYAVGLSLALTLVAEWLGGRAGQPGGAGSPSRGSLAGRWLRSALSPRRLAIMALLLLAFAWLPWQVVYWRPRWLSPNWQEAVFATIKLGLLYLYATIGWALMLRTASRR